MALFPTKEAKVSQLAFTVALGLSQHGDVFPNVSSVPLLMAINGYSNAKNNQKNSLAMAQLASSKKDISLGQLADVMKQSLQKAEVDVSGDPVKLSYIGWGPKEPPTPIEAPSQPLNLRVTSQMEGDVELQWDKPDTGGAVRNYLIEKRLDDGSWKLEDISYIVSYKIEIDTTPTELIYRIAAENKSGRSLPSNEVVVVI